MFYASLSYMSITYGIIASVAVRIIPEAAGIFKIG